MTNPKHGLAGEMVERVAEAIYEELCKDEYVGPYQARTWRTDGVRLDGNFNLEAVSRAAIAAMREPTTDMCLKGTDRARTQNSADAKTWLAEDFWKGMIGAALGETP